MKAVDRAAETQPSVWARPIWAVIPYLLCDLGQKLYNLSEPQFAYLEVRMIMPRPLPRIAKKVNETVLINADHGPASKEAPD